MLELLEEFLETSWLAIARAVTDLMIRMLQLLRRELENATELLEARATTDPVELCDEETYSIYSTSKVCKEPPTWLEPARDAV